MTALKAIFSRFHLGEHDKATSGERRVVEERRKSERRGNVLPFESRDKRLQLAAQIARFGTYDIDCLTGLYRWSPELKAIAGLSEDGKPVQPGQLEALVHPEDREAFTRNLQSSLEPEGDGSLEGEYRLLLADGAVRWVRIKGRTFFTGQDGDRRALGATGIVMDITDSRMTEQELADSRTELTGLIDAAIDAIITVDADQRVVRFNPAASRMFRCPMGQAIGSPLERFIPERYRRDHARDMRKFAESGVTGRTMGMPGIFAGLRSDGEEFPIEASIAKVWVEGQLRLSVFLRDITDRQAAEEKLRRSKEDLELAVRGAGLGVWSWDAGTGALSWSERCYQLFGIPPEQPMNCDNFLAAVYPEDRERVAAAAHRALENNEEYNIEYRTVSPDGGVHWICVIGRDLYNDAGGKAVGMRGIVLDISERKYQEERLLGRNEQLESRIEDRTAQLIQANEALERSNLELQQFAFIAAHDLQTPLRSISGFAQLLQKDYQGRINAQADAWLHQIVHSAHRMRDVINDILAYSRVESRGNVFRPTDMGRLLDEVLSTLDTLVQEGGAAVTRGDLPIVMGDRTQLAQVLQNLVDNGLKYHGDEPSRVHVSASRQGDEWVFSVRDNGIGIAQKYQEQIFDIFRRLHTEQQYPGTGIGLAVCRRVIHRHGGRIWVESELGRGSVFHFTLPVREKEMP